MFNSCRCGTASSSAGRFRVIQAVARVDDESARVAQFRGGAQAIEFAQAVALIPGVGIGAGVQLDDRRAERRRGLDLRRVGIDEKTDADATLGERLDRRRERLALPDDVEAAFGGDLATILRNEADVRRMLAQRDGHDLRCVAQLEVELRLDERAQPREIGVLQVPAVAPQVHRDRMRPGLLADGGGLLQIGFGVEGVGMRRVARLPQGGDVVDIDAEVEVGAGHETGTQHCGYLGDLKRPVTEGRLNSRIAGPVRFWQALLSGPAPIPPK